ncbi:hypothetical protein KQI65_13840 [bacterium]|nr:hypothetical protein [bacterium]
MTAAPRSLQFHFRLQQATGLLVLSLLLLSCTEETPQEPSASVVPSVTWEKPFELTSYTTFSTLLSRDTVRLSWVLYDTSMTNLAVWYRKIPKSEWTFLKLVPAIKQRTDVEVALWDAPAWRFAIARTDTLEMDSTAVIGIEQEAAYFIEPRENTIYFNSDSVLIHWRPKTDRPIRAILEYTKMGNEDWKEGVILGPADTVFTWTDNPLGQGGCYQMRLSFIDAPPSYVRGVMFGGFEVHKPQENAILYRFLPVDIDAEIHIPHCMNQDGETVYEFSSDGGSSWREVDKGWRLTADATNNAALRVSELTMGVSQIISPVIIEDRSTTFFELNPGLEMRYRHSGFRSTRYGSDTTYAEWYTIHVDDEIVHNDRIEYPCTITIERDGEAPTTEKHSLYQSRDGQQMISGNFGPFSFGEIFGLHDISIDSEQFSIVHSQGPDYVDRSFYVVERGRGISTGYHTHVSGHINPVGSGHRYVLMD